MSDVNFSNDVSELINVSNISISFTQYVKGLNQRELKVITDLTLDIKEGEIVAVLGSSGSGKSLLAHAILGILPQNANLSGTMMYKGEVLTEELKQKLRGDEIALIPQSVNFLDPLMKVSDQVIGECVDEEEEKEKRAKQRAIFEKYNLSEEVDDMYPFQLSGGMARRVLVSTALLSNPKLVIADEPTPGLDEKSVEETLNHLRQMSAENVGVLLITHDIDAALKVANRIAIFYSGYVIESLYKALPHNGFVLTKGHQPLHGEIPQGCPYFDRCSHKLEKCDKIRPNLIPVDEKKRVRCFKYEE